MNTMGEVFLSHDEAMNLMFQLSISRRQVEVANSSEECRAPQRPVASTARWAKVIFRLRPWWCHKLADISSISLE